MRGQRLREVNDEIGPVRMGFHALPSMMPLHLHVISQDFNASALKTKKHWNSFTTEFFIPLSLVERQLASFGRLTLDTARASEMLKLDVRCHKCFAECKTMPALKAHLKRCMASFSVADEPLYF